MSILFRGMVEGERRRQRRQFWFAWLVFCLALTGFFGLCFWLWNSFDARWARVRPGMSADQALSLLGEPHSKEVIDVDEPLLTQVLLTMFRGPIQEWSYTAPLEDDDQRHCVLRIFGGRVVAKEIRSIQSP